MATTDIDAGQVLDSATGINGTASGGTGSNMSATGGANHYVKQLSAGAAFTTGTLSADLASGILPFVIANAPSGADDYAYLQALVTAAELAGSGVILRDGVYLLSAELQIPADPTLVSPGMKLIGVTSKYAQSATGSGTTLRATGESMRSVLAVLGRNHYVGGLWIDAADKATYGVYEHTATWCQFENVVAWGAELDGWFVDENSGPNRYDNCSSEQNGTVHATTSILAEYSSTVRALIAGTAATTANIATITITGGPDLTTLSIRKGDLIRVGSDPLTAYFGMIESVTAGTVIVGTAANNRPPTSTSIQQYAIGVGDGYHCADNVNSNISIHAGGLHRLNGGSGMSLQKNTAVGDRVLGTQIDFSSFAGIVIGATDNAGQTVFGKSEAYTEDNIGGNYFIGAVDSFEITPANIDESDVIYHYKSNGKFQIHWKGYTENQHGAPQDWVIRVQNDAGTIKHQMLSDLFTGTGTALDRITGESATYAATPDVSGGATAFTAGAGLSTVALIFDTADQSGAVLQGTAVIEADTTGNGLGVSLTYATSSVNGVTRQRHALRLVSSAGVQTNWNTTNIPAGTSLAIKVSTRIK